MILTDPLTLLPPAGDEGPTGTCPRCCGITEVRDAFVGDRDQFRGARVVRVRVCVGDPDCGHVERVSVGGC